MTLLWMSIVAAVVCSSVLTGIVRRYALRRSILDIPNHRSSHAVPTPRGGGLAIAIVVLGGALAMGIAGWLPWRFAAALIGGGALVSAAGWLDDKRGLSASWRFFVHLAAASWAVACSRGLPTLGVGHYTLTLGALGSAIAVLLVVWLLNLYNFMDGIDGIAGSEALLVGGIGGAIALRAGDVATGSAALLVAAAAAGFLIWNWPPAKIFMGDVGSGLLGYLLAVIALFSERSGTGLPLLSWLLLLGVFVFDATVTLLRRVAHGERWYEAHHSHAYQRVVQAGWAHRRSTLTAAVLTILLGGLVLLGSVRRDLQATVLVAGFVLLGTAYALVERIRPMRRSRGVGDARLASGD